jgi:hypothetical protein
MMHKGFLMNRRDIWHFMAGALFTLIITTFVLLS